MLFDNLIVIINDVRLNVGLIFLFLMIKISSNNKHFFFGEIFIHCDEKVEHNADKLFSSININHRVFNLCQFFLTYFRYKGWTQLMTSIFNVTLTTNKKKYDDENCGRVGSKLLILSLLIFFFFSLLTYIFVYMFSGLTTIFSVLHTSTYVTAL